MKLPWTGARRNARTVNRMLILGSFIILAGTVLGTGVALATSGCGGASAATVTAQITVTQGMSASELATLLHTKGIIKSSRDFLNLIEANGLTGNLQQGTYTFSSNQTLTQIMNALKSGAVDANSKLVIPEGLATSQVLSLVTKVGVANAASYASLASQPVKFAVPSVGGTTPAVNTLEGLLFPSTYILQPGETSSLLIKAQLRAFAANTAPLPWGNASTLKVTPYQVVIIASIIEKEAQAVPDRPKIARVIYNRLAKSMTLGMDSTVRYATGKWSGALSAADLAVDSPYNTRIHKGLPPSPICNPGVAALTAALEPVAADYLYFVSDSSGNLFFTASYAEFLKVKSAAAAK